MSSELLGMPRVRIELDGMRESIVAALTRDHEEIDAVVNEALAEAIKKVDWRLQAVEVAKQEIDKAVKQSIEGFFRYGPGKKAVDAAVAEAFGGFGQKPAAS